MSKTRLLSSLAAALGVLAVAAWLVTGTFPLAAAPENVADSPGISVELGGASLMHRAPVLYPDAARQKGIQGTVTVQVRIDNAGNVSDAQVLSGPDELRKSALQSVLNWHFGSSAAGTLRQVSINFQTDGIPPAAAVYAAPNPITTIRRVPPGTAPGAIPPLKSIVISGLSDEATADLRSRLPVHEGDNVGLAELAQAIQVVRAFDSHLQAIDTFTAEGRTLLIRPQDAGQPGIPPPPPAPVSGTPVPGRIRVGGNVQAVKVVSSAPPAYPEPAKQARIQGTVKLDAIIAKDGKVQNLIVISGHPLLVPSALQAVQQWVYQPTTLNGQPVEVETEIDVNYFLAE